MHVKVVSSVSFGVNEDYSPEDSLSDNSEELFWRGKERGQYTCEIGQAHILAECCC